MSEHDMDEKTLTLQEDRGQYNYRPPRLIDATEYKWQFEDIKPLTNSATPLQFRIDTKLHMSEHDMDEKTLTLQEDRGQYNYRPPRLIDATEYKWQFEDIKPLTNSATPLQFRIDDRPYPFCPREMELHLKIKFTVGGVKAPAYHTNTANFIAGPVNNFGYSCICQVRCKVNNAETESVSGSSRGDGVTSAFSKLRPIWISHLYYFFPKMGKLK